MNDVVQSDTDPELVEAQKQYEESMAKFRGLKDARTFKVSAGLGDETSDVVNTL